MYFCLQLSGAPVKLLRLWAAGGLKEEESFSYNTGSTDEVGSGM